MQKKKFMGPFWVLLGMGILPAILALIITRVNLDRDIGLERKLYFIPFLIWPIIALIDLLVYWRIRKVNAYRQDSWRHVGLFVFAYLSLFIEAFVFILLPRRVNVNVSLQQMRGGNLIQTVVFGLLVICAHIFLVRVLRQIAAERKIEGQVAPENVNLLDDVLN